MAGRRARLLSSVALALAAATTVACERKEWKAAEADLEAVEVVAANVRVLTGPVGTGDFRSEATYVLVDARNRHTDDLAVTLAGSLVNEAGEVVGELRPKSLRIPGNGGVRMFSLIDRDQAARPAATGARVVVRGAMRLDYPPPVVVADGRVDVDEGRAVVAGTVINTAERPVSVIVFAGFYDASGAPVKQSSTLFRLDGRGERGTRFVGPAGSRSAYLYIGDAVY